jgi:hypothetical protein
MDEDRHPEACDGMRLKACMCGFMVYEGGHYLASSSDGAGKRRAERESSTALHDHNGEKSSQNESILQCTQNLVLGELHTWSRRFGTLYQVRTYALWSYQACLSLMLELFAISVNTKNIVTIGRKTYNIVRVEGLGQRSVGDVVVNAVIDEVALTSSSLVNRNLEYTHNHNAPKNSNLCNYGEIRLCSFCAEYAQFVFTFLIATAAREARGPAEMVLILMPYFLPASQARTRVSDSSWALAEDMPPP